MRRHGLSSIPSKLAAFTLCVYCWLPLALIAQVDKGQFHTGGRFSLESNESTSYHSFGFGLQPELGLMLSKRWSVGLGVPLAGNYSTNNAARYRLGVAPFLRYYFDLKSGFYALLHLQSEWQTALGSPNARNDLFRLQMYPALSYFFSPRFACEAGFGGWNYKRTVFGAPPNEGVQRERSLSFSAIPVFSLRYYFPSSSSTSKSIPK